jgi:hypothetical protein
MSIFSFRLSDDPTSTGQQHAMYFRKATSLLFPQL